MVRRLDKLPKIALSSIPERVVDDLATFHRTNIADSFARTDWSNATKQLEALITEVASILASFLVSDHVQKTWITGRSGQKIHLKNYVRSRVDPSCDKVSETQIRDCNLTLGRYFYVKILLIARNALV